MQALLKTLPSILKEVPDDSVREAVVIAIWPTAVGEPLRERCAARALNDRVLEVAVADAEWKREFEQHASQILYKLNAALGMSLVERLEFTADPKFASGKRKAANARTVADGSFGLPSNEIVAAANRISDKELREHFLIAASKCSDRLNA